MDSMLPNSPAQWSAYLENWATTRVQLGSDEPEAYARIDAESRSVSVMIPASTGLPVSAGYLSWDTDGLITTLRMRPEHRGGALESWMLQRAQDRYPGLHCANQGRSPECVATRP